MITTYEPDILMVGVFVHQNVDQHPHTVALLAYPKVFALEETERAGSE
jgi:hypothetical protein